MTAAARCPVTDAALAAAAVALYTDAVTRGAPAPTLDDARPALLRAVARGLTWDAVHDAVVAEALARAAAAHLARTIDAALALLDAPAAPYAPRRAPVCGRARDLATLLRTVPGARTWRAFRPAPRLPLSSGRDRLPV